MEVRAATPADLPAAFDLINAAYEVETGDSGVAFKHTLRFLQPEELSPQLERAFVAVDGHGKLLGVIVFELVQSSSGVTRCHFGPFAVAHSGQGVGKALLVHLEAFALAAGASSLDIEVVQHRTDILPMYAKWGYVQYGEAPFPAPERVTRPCHFLLLRRAIGQ